MREAKIKCPHCGETVIVRDAGDASALSAEQERKIWAAADAMFAAVEDGFRKIGKLWPSR